MGCNKCQSPCSCTNTLFPPCCATQCTTVAANVPCTPHYPCVSENFTVPASGVETAIKVTNSLNLYVGQGISLDNQYFIITELTDSTNIKIIHYGTATPGTTIVAIHPTYGCYQFPIVPIGIISHILNDLTLVGLQSDRETEVASSIVGTPVIQSMSYGYLSPTRVQFSIELEVEIANTPAFIGVQLDVAPSTTSPLPVFSGAFNDGSGLEIGVAALGIGAYEDFAIIGPGGAGTIANGANKIFLISGEYSIEL